jgi:hypothetical protein
MTTNVLLGNNTAWYDTYETQTGRLKKSQVWAKLGWVQDLEYGYTDAGELNSITDHQNANYSQTFVYDEYGRLKQAKGVYGDHQYEVDPCGNLRKNGALELKYDSASHPHAVSSVGGKEYVYDARGGLTQRPGENFTYGSRNLLSAISSNDKVVKFLHDSAGQRVRKIVYTQKSQNVFITAGLPGSYKMNNKNPFTATELNGTPTSGGGIVMETPFEGMEVEIAANGERTYRYHVQVWGQRVAPQTIEPDGEEKTTYLVTDYLGSGGQVLDEGGSVLEECRYDPYGAPLDADGNKQYTGWEHQTALYVGAEVDPTTHLYLTGPRTYDPVLSNST